MERCSQTSNGHSGAIASFIGVEPGIGLSVFQDRLTRAIRGARPAGRLQRSHLQSVQMQSDSGLRPAPE